ncbi:MAG: N-(5'-phosphoribosyl)anthranilate isomerase, partial [Acidobacteria bacterium]
MTWIKICGITNIEDAQTAINAGADALGFVFYDKSPRRVEVGVAQNIVRELPNQIEKVG